MNDSSRLGSLVCAGRGVCSQSPSRATISCSMHLVGRISHSLRPCLLCRMSCMGMHSVLAFQLGGRHYTFAFVNCVPDMHHCGWQARTTRTSQSRVLWNVAPHRQCAPRGHLSAPTPLSAPEPARLAQAGRTSKRTPTVCLRARCGERVPKASLYPRMPQPPATQNVHASVIAPAKNMNHGRQRRRQDASAQFCPNAERGFAWCEMRRRQPTLPVGCVAKERTKTHRTECQRACRRDAAAAGNSFRQTHQQSAGRACRAPWVPTRARAATRKPSASGNRPTALVGPTLWLALTTSCLTTMPSVWSAQKTRSRLE